MPLTVLAMASSTWATGLPIPGPLELRDRSIQWQELYPIALACLLWGHQWSGKKLLFHCDNRAVVDIWASGTSRDPLIMHLVCSIFLNAAINHYQSLILLALITLDISVPSPHPNSRLSPNPGSSISSDSLAHCLAFLQSQAIADSTHRSCQAGIRTYSTFCASMRWQSFSAMETTLRFFAAYLADQVSVKTIKLYLAGIRFVHIENSLPDPFQEAPLLHLLLRGIKRTVGLSSRQQLPITDSPSAD